jgi:hypothetical protein
MSAGTSVNRIMIGIFLSISSKVKHAYNALKTCNSSTEEEN